MQCATAYSQYYRGLKVSLDQRPTVQNIVLFYDKYDKGQGNASIVYDEENIYKWSGNPLIDMNLRVILTKKAKKYLTSSATAT
ncbi:MAG: hypothetical protein OHK0057_34650 [Thermoflexibacter sp.]